MVLINDRKHPITVSEGKADSICLTVGFSRSTIGHTCEVDV